MKHGGPAQRALVPVASVAAQARALRGDAEQRYSEVHLLAAALQDHIEDLRIERDRLLSQVARLRDDVRRDHSGWLDRGMKPNRS